jgi:YHS domain-containing protein
MIMLLLNDNNKGSLTMEKIEPSKTIKNLFIDPVCGMKVEPTRTYLLVNYEGCTYYFCAEGCRKAFEANPKKYLKGKHPKRKGWWGRYLERLEKATGGKSMECH